MKECEQCSTNLAAYFSMEIGFRNDIPTYSGGLGVLAGDTIKSFADLGIDAVAVTLLSSKGYFTQSFDPSGYQQEADTTWDYASLLHKHDQTVQVQIQGRTVTLGVWSYKLTGVRGDEVTIYFLDADREENTPEDRQLTSHLYGGDHQYRLSQEIILGIGGARMLHSLGYTPKKYHMNEGHAAFLVLELFSLQEGSDEEKHQKVKELCSFTTHTPVPAGHDKFSVDEAQHYIGELLTPYVREKVVQHNEVSTTVLALEFSSYTNAVARKHQEVSKHMFPTYDIDYITNGVHVLTWTSKHFANLFDTYIIDWKTNPMELRNALRIPEIELLNAHKRAKQELIDYINTTYDVGFETDVFTLVWARRAASYKRMDLILRNVQRLKTISQRVGKLQIIFAGKAHPHDVEMKKMIQHVINMREQLAPYVKVVFVENYMMFTGKLLTAGADLWLNNPKRPLEASGTSGMKAALNGVPSLSVPDGWWIEGLIEGVTGWSIGEELISEHNPGVVDEHDANEIYNKLEHKILPLYYTDKNEYARIMRNAIALNGSYFNTHRMVKQYFLRAYIKKC